MSVLVRARRSAFAASALMIGAAIVLPATAFASEVPPPPPTSERPVASSTAVKSAPVSNAVRVTVTVKAPLSRAGS